MDTLTFAVFAIFALVVVGGLVVFLMRGGKFNGKIGLAGVEVKSESPRPDVMQSAKNQAEITASPIHVDPASGATVKQEADTKGKIKDSGIEIK